MRWRVTGTEQWSDIAPCSPVGEIVVEGLDRTKPYDFEVRAVSACGARSAWGTASNTVPIAPPGTLVLADIANEVTTAQADADAANAALADIASDNLLTPGEKPVVIRDYNVITTEQAGIDAQATAYAITTEKTAYDTAVSALTTYLATLTAPVLWSNLTGNTTIVGATFRSKFADVYTTRQTLLNAIYAAAKAKADAAQATANIAQSNLYIIDPNFISGINYWAVDYFPGGWYGETGGVSPSPLIGTYAVHAGSTVAVNTNHIATTALRNTGFGVVNPGHIISASVLIRPSGGPDGTADVRISWRNSSQAEIRVDRGNQITNATGTGMSRVTGTAPAGAVYAHIEVGAYSHTVGYYTYTAADWNYQPNSLDEVPNSATYLKSLARAQGLVENGDFEVGAAGVFPPPGWALGTLIVGSSVVSQSYDTISMYAGTRAYGFTATQYNGVESIRSYQVNPGDYYAIGGAVVGASGAAVYALYFFNAANVQVGNIAIASNTSGWAYKTNTGKVPATAVYAKLIMANFNPGSVAVEFDALFMARCSSYDNALAIANSGSTLGNQFNAPNSLTMAYGSVRSTTALTATSAGAVSVSAFTAYLGGASVSYSAVSNAVTGLTVGSTYQIYCHDPSPPTGGTKTWFAATSVQAAMQQGDDVVLGGQVTIPSTGSSGGGGSGGCPVREAWVLRRGPNGEHEQVRAGDVVVGDYLLLTSGRWGLVTQSAPKLVPCVRVTNTVGYSLCCSRTAPLGLEEGAPVLAPEALDEYVMSRAGHWIDGIRINAIDDIGDRWVQHITCEDDFFWVGDDPECLFSHHNLKP
ncbi:hypothetical protein EAH75_04345 [Rhodanobacter glycinis]|nr:hypothetical protein EAH75_04345 [Rhodanobacter glycinis]